MTCICEVQNIVLIREVISTEQSHDQIMEQPGNQSHDQPCDISHDQTCDATACKPNRKPATDFCEKCRKRLCDTCAVKHRTLANFRSHEMVDIKKVAFCLVHPSLKAVDWCNTCNSQSCCRCILENVHEKEEGHHVVSYETKVNDTKEHLVSLTESGINLDSALNKLDNMSNEIGKDEEEFLRRVDKIKSTLEECKSRIDSIVQDFHVRTYSNLETIVNMRKTLCDRQNILTKAQSLLAGSDLQMVQSAADVIQKYPPTMPRSVSLCNTRLSDQWLYLPSQLLGCIHSVSLDKKDTLFQLGEAASAASADDSRRLCDEPRVTLQWDLPELTDDLWNMSASQRSLDKSQSVSSCVGGETLADSSMQPEISDSFIAKHLDEVREQEPGQNYSVSEASSSQNPSTIVKETCATEIPDTAQSDVAAMLHTTAKSSRSPGKMTDEIPQTATVIMKPQIKNTATVTMNTAQASQAPTQLALFPTPGTTPNTPIIDTSSTPASKTTPGSRGRSRKRSLTPGSCEKQVKRQLLEELNDNKRPTPSRLSLSRRKSLWSRDTVSRTQRTLLQCGIEASPSKPTQEPVSGLPGRDALSPDVGLNSSQNSQLGENRNPEYQPTQHDKDNRQ